MTKTPIGLRIETMLEQKTEKHPVICRFIYMLDIVKFQAWVEEHAYLMDGVISMFNVKGLDILIAGKQASKTGKADWENASFCLRDKDSIDMPISLKLLHKEVVFVVHRDPISRKEWCVLLQDCVAAQSRSNEG